MPEVISVSKTGHQFQIYCIHLNMLWFYFICIHKNRIRAVNSCSPSISQCWRRIPSTDFGCKPYCFAWALSHVQLFETPWTIACHAFLSMGLSRQEYWRRLPFSLPRDLHDPRIDLVFSVVPVLAGGFFTAELPGKLDTSWVLCNLTPFWHHPPEDSIRPYRVRAQFQESAPTTTPSSPSHK